MFPSRLEPDGAMKGGLILIKLKRTTDSTAKNNTPVEVVLEYEDVHGASNCHTDTVEVPAGDETSFTAGYETAQHKGVLLQRYAEA